MGVVDESVSNMTCYRLVIFSLYLSLSSCCFPVPEPEPAPCIQVLCCGSDGVTYPNPCSTPPGVACVDFNECPVPEPEPCIQVLCCGSDGVTYPNPCSTPPGVTCVDNNK